MTIYLAIFKQADGNEYVIEYRPFHDDIAGGIEIISVTHTKRAVTWQEQRTEYQHAPCEQKPRQLNFERM